MQTKHSAVTNNMVSEKPIVKLVFTRKWTNQWW